MPLRSFGLHIILQVTKLNRLGVICALIYMFGTQMSGKAAKDFKGNPFNLHIIKTSVLEFHSGPVTWLLLHTNSICFRCGLFNQQVNN